MNFTMDLRLKGITIPRQYRVVLMFLLPVLLIMAAYFLVFDGQLQNKKKLMADVGAMRQEIARMTAMKNDLGKTRREFAALKEDLQAKLREMPEEREVPNLLRQVSLIAQEAKTRMKYFAPKESQAREFYWELPFEMKYTAPYHSVGYFFDGIRRLERIIHVTSFSLEAKEGGRKTMLEGTCTAKTYVFMKEPEKEKAKLKMKEDKNVPGRKDSFPPYCSSSRFLFPFPHAPRKDRRRRTPPGRRTTLPITHRTKGTPSSPCFSRNR